MDSSVGPLADLAGNVWVWDDSFRCALLRGSFGSTTVHCSLGDRNHNDPDCNCDFDGRCFWLVTVA